MKVRQSRHLQKIGEAHVAELIERMGHSWREAGNESYGIDGFIEIVARERPTGHFIGVQIKAGRGHFTTNKMRKSTARRFPDARRQIRIKGVHLTYFRTCKFPVIVVWFDPVSENTFWGAVDAEATGAFPIPNVFDRFAGRRLARVADRWHAVYPEFADSRIPDIPVKAVKPAARLFYNALRAEGCVSPALGEVRFTLRGWRHITKQNRQRRKILSSLELLGAAVTILTHHERFHVCRVTPRRHVLCKQTARITSPHRADAIVSVITEKIGDGPHQFLSVYEHGKSPAAKNPRRSSPNRRKSRRPVQA